MVDGDPKWSKGIDLVSKPRVDCLDQLCRSLKEQMPLLPTPENLSANPGMFIPFLARILSTIEDEFYQEDDEEKKPNLYSLLPTPTLRWKYILVNAKSLACNTRGTRYVRGFQGEQELFHNVFDFSCFGYERWVFMHYFGFTNFFFIFLDIKVCKT